MFNFCVIIYYPDAVGILGNQKQTPEIEKQEKA
jgi:hypothetical protein